MSDTLLASLTSTLSPSTRELAQNLGETEQAVSRGLEQATAAILSALSRKTGDPEALRRVVDLASKTSAGVLPPAVSSGRLDNPSSPLLSGGKGLLASLFGNSQEAILNSLSRESGMQAGAAATVLAVAAQSVLSFIGKRVRDEGMTATTLSGFLHSAGIDPRSPLQDGVLEASASSHAGATARDSSPVIAQEVETDSVIAQTVQTVRKERSFLYWLVPLALILIGLLWLAFRGHQPPAAETPVVPAATDPATPDLGRLVPRQLPDGTTLNIPERGVEGRLLAFIQDPSRAPDKTTWFDFDRLLFNTGSATLQPRSEEQLHNIAAILKAYPRAHLKIGGYTDNVGSAASNLKLSQDRATNVMNELVQLGVAPDRLTAQGYGETHAVASNSTDEGRALNRRISMLVTQK